MWPVNYFNASPNLHPNLAEVPDQFSVYTTLDYMPYLLHRINLALQLII